MNQTIFFSLLILCGGFTVSGQTTATTASDFLSDYNGTVTPVVDEEKVPFGSKSLQQSIVFYSTFDEFETACSNLDSLTFEDFEGGPDADFQRCGTAISFEGGECFPADEIQEGVVYTNSGADVGATMIFVNRGSFFNIPDPGVSSNNFFSSTHVQFTREKPVTSVAFDLYSPIGSGIINLRIFGVTSGLLDTASFNASNVAQFVGFNSEEEIERIELQNPDNVLIETVAQFYFGSCDIALSSDEAFLSNVNYFPNPAKNEITINAEAVVENIEVYALNGQQLTAYSTNSPTPSFDISTLAPGIYFAKFYSKDQVGTFKFVKE